MNIPSLYLPQTKISNEAVLLINLGSPDSPEIEDVKRYLSDFLLDERVISIPPFWRRLLVNGLIIPWRAPYSARNYQKIWDADTRTFPLVRHSSHIAHRLCQAMGMPVALAMRYGMPNMDDALRSLHEIGTRHIYVQALYPQYTRSSFETAVVHAQERLTQLGLSTEMTLHILPAFYDEVAYRTALAESIRPHLAQPYDRLILSMHGIPLSHLSRPCQLHNGSLSHCRNRVHSPQESSTCYRLHCERTAEFLRQDLKLQPHQIELVYQSRLGRHEWIKPYFSTRVRQWPNEGIRRILVVSPCFVCDCLETLEEIDHEYRKTFLKHGGESFTYIPCLNSSSSLIETLNSLISHHLRTAPSSIQ